MKYYFSLFLVLCLACNPKTVSTVSQDKAEEYLDFENETNPASQTKQPTKVNTSKKDKKKPTEVVEVISENTDLRFKIIEEALAQIGAKYKYAGSTNAGYDCSGLLYYAASTEGITLPRSSSAMSQEGVLVDENDIQAGDFIFFTGREASSGRVGHVAMVTKHEPGATYVVHATSGRGVIEELIQNNSYFMPRWLFVKRILPEN